MALDVLRVGSASCTRVRSFGHCQVHAYSRVRVDGGCRLGRITGPNLQYSRHMKAAFNQFKWRDKPSVQPNTSQQHNCSLHSSGVSSLSPGA